MAREVPYADSSTTFKTTVPVLVTHLNYGNHLGYDALLSIIHEARMRFLKAHQLTELSLDGGSIGYQVVDLAVSYKSEAFHGDQLDIELYISDVTKKTFSIHYKIINQRTAKVVAFAETGHIFYDFQLKKVALAPVAFLEAVQPRERSMPMARL